MHGSPRKTISKRPRPKYAAIALQIILVMSAAIPAAAQDEGTQYVITQGTPLYEEIMPLALMWKHAILARQYDDMLANYIPGDVQLIRKQLSNAASPLHKTIYDTPYVRTMKSNGRSSRQILHDARNPKIVLVGTEPVAQRGVTAYFYDEAAQKLAFPMPQRRPDRLLLKDVASVSFIRCAKRCKKADGGPEWKIIFPYEPEPE